MHAARSESYTGTTRPIRFGPANRAATPRGGRYTGTGHALGDKTMPEYLRHELTHQQRRPPVCECGQPATEYALAPLVSGSNAPINGGFFLCPACGQEARRTDPALTYQPIPASRRHV